MSSRVQALLRPASRAGSDSLVSRIAAFVHREDLEDQFRDAHLVAVAELTDSIRVCGDGRCQRVLVHERIKGDAGQGAIWVESARAGRPRQRVLLFASPNTRGEWTGSGGFGGFRTLRDGTVEGTTRSLAEVIERFAGSRANQDP